MARIKTESEVATMRYLREHTSVPVPIIYHYDANPYNRLGGEYILMSKVCHGRVSLGARALITCLRRLAFPSLKYIIPWHMHSS